MKSAAKIQYLVLMVTTVLLGLISRKISVIPPICGDVLYAMMVYWLSRLIFIKKSLFFCCITAILCCFTIEFLQLVQLPLFLLIRSNSLLRLVFGQGFLWSDLGAYCLGALGAAFLDYLKDHLLKTDPAL